MMKKLFAYFKHPTESIAKEDSASIKSLILFYILMQGLFIMVMVPFALAGIVPESSLTNLKESGLPFWFIAFIVPALEELAFRLPLKRSRFIFMISFSIICWYISKYLPIFAGQTYSGQHLWLRLSVSITAGFILGYFLAKPLQKVRFGVLFYVFAFLFGFLHIFNYAGQITSFAIALYVLIYLLNKVAAGMFFGYIRVRYTIFASITVHFLNNFFPLAAAYYILG